MTRWILAVVAAAGWFGSAQAQSTTEPITGAEVPCVDGAAAGFSCDGVTLLSFLPIAGLGGSTLVIDTLVFPVTVNDVWGWTDPESGREYALVGRSDGTAFVEVTDPVHAVFLGLLPSHDLIAGGAKRIQIESSGSSDVDPVLQDGIGQRVFKTGYAWHDDKGVGIWRDIKVYENFAFVVADATPNHGVQVFDLTQLRAVEAPPVVFEETAHYDGMGSAHNIAINEETGFAYVVGSNGEEGCGGGLHMVDISDPLNPVFSGCFADVTTGRAQTGYTHDVQCVIYRGPDAEHAGKEICFGSNETALSVADVTDKLRPVAISTGSYPDAEYIHQGWLTDDHRYFYQDDELDESTYGFATRTIIWDLEDLEEPRVLGMYHGTTQAIDHNQYVVGDRLFQSNYKAGLRILDISTRDAPAEVGYFDTYPAADNRGFEGSWSNYPFFESGVVLVSSIREGLFVVRPAERTPVAVDRDELPTLFALTGAFPNPFRGATRLGVRMEQTGQLRITVHDVLGREVREIHDGLLSAGSHDVTFDASGLSSGTYLIRAQGAAGARSVVVTLLN